MITYAVKGNEIVEPEKAAVGDELLEYQQDTATHERIWNYYANLIPADQRQQLDTFVIFTDGPENTMASVQQTLDDPEKWLLAVDITDAGDPEELTYTLIHEFGHLLTLNAEQVPPDAELLYQPDDEALYEQAVAACPRYFPGEGCSEPNAYINAFYERFWTEIHAEWDDINYIEDEDEYYAALDDFYAAYETEFVSDYAATSPEEDIAESWTQFVLQPKPTDDSIAGQKVLFFYDYPELVKPRAEIMTRTYSRLRRR